MAIENLFHAVNVRSALKLGHARGVAMLAAVEAGVPVFEYTPAEIKRAVVGYGRAEKHQVQQMVKLILGLAEPAVTARRRRCVGGRHLSRAFGAAGPHCRSDRADAAQGRRDQLAAVSTRTVVIAHLRGRILEKQPNRIVVDANGVGYDVSVPLSTFYGLGDPGSEIALRIHTHVREDALSLYGFATRLEQELFERLISISGIGPKLALAVLSGIEPPELVRAIERADLARLTAIPGVGKKTSERIIVELKDRLPRAPVASAGERRGARAAGHQGRRPLCVDQPGVSSATRRKSRGRGRQGDAGRRFRTDAATGVERIGSVAAGRCTRAGRRPDQASPANTCRTHVSSRPRASRKTRSTKPA